MVVATEALGPDEKKGKKKKKKDEGEGVGLRLPGPESGMGPEQAFFAGLWMAVWTGITEMAHGLWQVGPGRLVEPGAPEQRRRRVKRAALVRPEERGIVPPPRVQGKKRPAAGVEPKAVSDEGTESMARAMEAQTTIVAEPTVARPAPASPDMEPGQTGLSPSGEPEEKRERGLLRRLRRKPEKAAEEKETVIRPRALTFLEEKVGIPKETAQSVFTTVVGVAAKRSVHLAATALEKFLVGAGGPTAAAATAVVQVGLTASRKGAKGVYERYAIHPREYLGARRDRRTGEFKKESVVKRAALTVPRMLGRGWMSLESAAVQVVYGQDRRRWWVVKFLEELGASDMTEADLVQADKWEQFLEQDDRLKKLLGSKRDLKQVSNLVEALSALERFGFGTSVYGERGPGIYRVNERLGEREVLAAALEGLRRALPQCLEDEQGAVEQRMLRQLEEGKSLGGETAVVAVLHAAVGLAKVVGTSLAIDKVEEVFSGRVEAEPQRVGELTPAKEAGAEKAEMPDLPEGSEFEPEPMKPPPAASGSAMTEPAVEAVGVSELPTGAGEVVPGEVPADLLESYKPEEVVKEFGCPWDRVEGVAEAVATENTELAEGLARPPVTNAVKNIVNALNSGGGTEVRMPSEETIRELQEATLEVVNQVDEAIEEGQEVREVLEGLPETDRMLWELGRVGFIRDELPDGRLVQHVLTAEEAEELVKKVAGG